MSNKDRRWWEREHRQIEGAMRGDISRTSKRDPIALAVGVANLLAFAFTWVWWARGVDADLVTLKEWRVEEIRGKREDARENVNVDAMQTVQIVELQKDVKYMRETLDRIDRKIPERSR